MLLLGGCMVGPKYSKPTTPLAPAFKEEPPASFKEGDGWKTAQPNDQLLRGDWWTMFNDPQLNALEGQIEAANQTLRAADANYRAARAAVMFARVRAGCRNRRSPRRPESSRCIRLSAEPATVR